MATHTFQIIVTQSGAQATAQAITQVGAAAQKSANALAFFRQALVVASTIRAAAGFVNLIDAATRIDNRLRVATKSASEFARAQEFVYQISRQTRTEVEANAVTYGRLLRSTDSLGLSTEFLERVMKGLALSIKVGGATSMEARNSLIQFSQSLASGALRGDELRSVAEQLPALAEAIGREFGVSGGQLIAFAKANPGILETERVVKAVAAAVPELEKEAAKMVPTVAEGFIAIKNGAIEMLGEINRGTGIFSALSRALVFVGENLNAVVFAVGGLLAMRFAATIGAWGGALSGAAGNFGAFLNLVRQGNGVMASFSALFMVNPITIWIAAIAAAGAALIVLYNNFPVVKAAVDGFFTSIGVLVETLYKIAAAIGQSLPSWVTLDGTMNVVVKTIALLIAAFGNIVTFAMVPFVLAAEGIVRALNAVGLASNESVAAMANARAELFTYAQGLLTGQQASTDAGAATEQLTEKTKSLLAPLLGAKGGTDALKSSTSELADAVKRADENSALFVAGRFVNDGSWMQGSIEGFNNLARVTKDWEKYTTDAGTAVTQTASASAQAKAPTDSLAGSMKGVNTQASGAASASRTMATAMAASAESSTTAAKQVKEMSDIMAKLNPLLLAAKAAGEAAAAGFRAAGAAAQSAVTGINNLAEAYRQLAAAKAAAGSGGSSGSGSSAPVEARAAGGPVISGNTYLVGEKGPELFTPGATGNIIPNHALVSGGTTAANDNTTLIVRAINRMANAVVASNKAAAKSNEAVVEEIAIQNTNAAKALKAAAVPYQVAQSFKGSGYSLNSTYVDQDARGEMQYALPGDYAEWAKKNKVLQGDEAYRMNTKVGFERGMNYFSAYEYDANNPYAEQAAQEGNKLAIMEAGLERYGLDAYAYSGINILSMIEEQKRVVQFIAEKSETAIKALKEYREAGANYDQFMAALPEMAKVASKMQDFQTYTPMQGGPDYGSHDPYGLGNAAPRPDEAAKDALAAGKGVGAQDNRVQVQMTINTPSAESFRQNKAQIESAVASMVDRANRRAGRR